MVRFIVVIISCFFLILYYVPKMSYYARHPEDHDEEKCYRLARKVVQRFKKRGRISTVSTGTENLPQEGGYIMYANHQGKYDALGIIGEHQNPCTFVMDAKRSKLFIADQFCSLLRAKRLEKGNIRQQVEIINEVATEIEAGRRYILFPEGGYDHNHNTLNEFMPGSFKIAKKAGCPIVPVVLYDSYKPFEGRSLRSVVTQLAFLEPIPYEDYESLSTSEIRDMVVNIIQQKMNTMSGMNNW